MEIFLDHGTLQSFSTHSKCSGLQRTQSKLCKRQKTWKQNHKTGYLDYYKPKEWTFDVYTKINTEMLGFCLSYFSILLWQNTVSRASYRRKSLQGL